jgi:hypothetical protein
MKIDRRKFLKWTGYMVAAAVVAPTELLKEKVSVMPFEPVGYIEISPRAIWSKKVYEEAKEKTLFPLFVGENKIPGHGVIIVK